MSTLRQLVQAVIDALTNLVAAAIASGNGTLAYIARRLVGGDPSAPTAESPSIRDTLTRAIGTTELPTGQAAPNDREPFHRLFAYFNPAGEAWIGLASIVWTIREAVVNVSANAVTIQNRLTEVRDLLTDVRDALLELRLDIAGPTLGNETATNERLRLIWEKLFDIRQDLFASTPEGVVSIRTLLERQIACCENQEPPDPLANPAPVNNCWNDPGVAWIRCSGYVPLGQVQGAPFPEVWAYGVTFDLQGLFPGLGSYPNCTVDGRPRYRLTGEYTYDLCFGWNFEGQGTTCWLLQVPYDPGNEAVSCIAPSESIVGLLDPTSGFTSIGTIAGSEFGDTVFSIMFQFRDQPTPPSRNLFLAVRPVLA